MLCLLLLSITGPFLSLVLPCGWLLDFACCKPLRRLTATCGSTWELFSRLALSLRCLSVRNIDLVECRQTSTKHAMTGVYDWV